MDKYGTSSTTGESTKPNRTEAGGTRLPERSHWPAPPSTKMLQLGHCFLWRGEQHLYLGLHCLQRFHQTAHIHRSHAGGMEQQASLHRKQSHAEQEPLPDDTFGQIVPIFGSMDQKHLAGLRYAAEIHAQAAQICPEDTAPLRAKPAAQPSGKSRLRGKKTKVLF